LIQIMKPQSRSALADKQTSATQKVTQTPMVALGGLTLVRYF